MCLVELASLLLLSMLVHTCAYAALHSLHISWCLHDIIVFLYQSMPALTPAHHSHHTDLLDYDVTRVYVAPDIPLCNISGNSHYLYVHMIAAHHNRLWRCSKVEPGRQKADALTAVQCNVG